MLNIKCTTATLAFATLSSAMLVSNAGAAGLTGTAADYGVQVMDATPARHIAISGQSKWANVTNGETVQFAVAGKTFTWHFDTFNNETAFDLSKIVPAGVEVPRVTVYVAGNPLYRG